MKDLALKSKILCEPEQEKTVLSHLFPTGEFVGLSKSKSG